MQLNHVFFLDLCSLFKWNSENVLSNLFSDMHSFYQLKGIKNLVPVVFYRKKKSGLLAQWKSGLKIGLTLIFSMSQESSYLKFVIKTIFAKIEKVLKAIKNIDYQT